MNGIIIQFVIFHMLHTYGRGNLEAFASFEDDLYELFWLIPEDVTGEFDSDESKTCCRPCGEFVVTFCGELCGKPGGIWHLLFQMCGLWRVSCLWWKSTHRCKICRKLTPNGQKLGFWHLLPQKVLIIATPGGGT